MRALVTGAEGFVGRHLAPKLEAAGYEVIRSDFGKTGHQLDAAPALYGPIPALLKSIECGADWVPHEFDLVVHLAANIVNVDARMKGGISMYGDIALDLAMCRWLEENPPTQCAVLMSSCAVDFPEDPYCIVKRNLEAFAQTLHKKGVPVIVLRPFSGYGEDQSEEYPFRAILERALRREDPLTVWGGNQVRDWIHIDDLTDAILFAVKELPRRADPVEVGTRRGTSLLNVARLMADAAGYLPRIAGDERKASSSLRRVAGENGNAILQAWGWAPKITLEDAITSAAAARVEATARI